MSKILLGEYETAPDAPSSGQVIIYPKSDKKLYSKDDTGTETLLGGDPKKPNEYKIDYKNANYNLNLSDDQVVVFYHTTGTVTLTIPLTTTAQTDGYGKEYMFLNLGGGIVEVECTGTNVFSNGLAKMRVPKGVPFRVAIAYPTLGVGILRTSFYGC